jgi:hypothetical protein
VLTHRAGLLQQLVNQGGFTMIYMGDDGYISEVFDHGNFQLSGPGCEPDSGGPE